VERAKDRQIKRKGINIQDSSSRRAYKRCEKNVGAFFFTWKISIIYVFSFPIFYISIFPDFPAAAFELLVLNLSLNSKQSTTFYSRPFTTLPPTESPHFYKRIPFALAFCKSFSLFFPNLFIYFGFSGRVCVFVVFMALFRFRVSAMKVQTSKMQLFLSHIDTQPIRTSVSWCHDTGSRIVHGVFSNIYIFIMEQGKK